MSTDPRSEPGHREGPGSPVNPYSPFSRDAAQTANITPEDFDALRGEPAPLAPRVPVTIDEADPMPAAELRTMMEWLGLEQGWLAACLHVQERTVRRWIAGTTPVPEFARAAVEGLESATADAVGQVVSALHDDANAVIVVYATDEELRAARPDLDWPARWWRMVAARAAHEVPGVSIRYPAAN